MLKNIIQFSDMIPEISGSPFVNLSSDVNRYVLDNGMVILTKEVYPTNVVFLSLWARVGSSYEIDEEAGISHFVEHMLFKTTKKRGLGQIAQEIHALGGYLNGFTSYDCTAYWMVLPGSSFNKAMEILYDAIFNPLFDPAEVEKEANVILEEIAMYKDRPESYLSKKLMREAFQKHNYGRPIIGFEEVVKNATASQLQKYYHHYYKPNNCFLVAVGDLDTMEVVQKSERIYRKLKEGNIEKLTSTREPAQKELRRVDLTGRIQSGHIQMAFHIPSIFDKDTYPLALIANVLGNGKSSRLYRELREKRKLVNDVAAYTYSQKDPCLMFIDMELPQKNMKATEEAVFEILEDLRKNGITEKEFERARNLEEFQYVAGQETVEAQGRKVGYAEIMGDYMLVEKYIQRLLSVSREEAEEAACQYLVPFNCTVGTYQPGDDEEE
ncbi:MAG: M16 family metallopeptidase [Vulcanimicrobiota bacterium]